MFAAVFSVDDDMEVDEKDVYRAFNVWKVSTKYSYMTYYIYYNFL